VDHCSRRSVLVIAVIVAACAAQPSKTMPAAPLSPARRAELCPAMQLPISTDATIFEPTTLDSRPKMIAHGPSRWPLEYHMRRDRTLTIPIQLVVSAEGEIEPGTLQGPRAADEATRAFVEAALSSIRGSEFCPGTRAGHRVRSRMSFGLNYQTG